MRLTRAQSQEVTHERLLAAGHAVFVRRGFLTATVEEVAADAGYTRGAVYKHFGGKEGLWHAIVRAQSATLIDRLRQALSAVTTRDELLAVLNPGPAVSDPAMARWAVISAEATAALSARPEHVNQIAEVQHEVDAELIRALTACCERLHLQPSMPVRHVIVAWGALGGGLALRQAIGTATDVTTTAAGVLSALFPARDTRDESEARRA